jgi:hypothetical protein
MLPASIAGELMADEEAREGLVLMIQTVQSDNDLTEVLELAREQRPSTPTQLTLAREIAKDLKGLKFPDVAMEHDVKGL